MSEKPSLSGIMIASKGEAARPRAEYVPPPRSPETQRKLMPDASVAMVTPVDGLESVAPATVPNEPAPVEARDLKEIAAAAPLPFKYASKAMTLRLEENVYQDLRAFAFERNRTHQDVMANAVIEYIKRHSKKSPR